jgi:cellulose synthase/poly-beta-1,6-N-acetylglucosamine synthase-like glycosyltransferase
MRSSSGIDLDHVMESRRLGRESVLTRVGIAFTLGASLLLGCDLVGILVERLRSGSPAAVIEQLVFLAIAASLLWGNLVYQLARLGHLRRRRALERAPAAELEALYDEAPAVAMLVPSYREEPRLVRQTLLSAALQDHPRRRVVLLIDDPPEPADAEGVTLLRAARRLPGEVQALLEKPARRFAAELAEFSRRADAGNLDLHEETLHLASLYAEVAAWFETQAANQSESDHTDRLFVDLVFRAPARGHLERTLALEAAAESGDLPDAGHARREYRRLAALFAVELTSFERKRYVNLSHAPNKAMNLNAYIGLLGRRFREEVRPDGCHLVATSRRRASLRVPEAEFLVTLDADTVLTSSYVLRLVHELRRPGHERVAVVQTPYTAVPGAPGLLERVAGATTDVQYVIHQGFTSHGATFWVGANAVLRRAAIADLRFTRRERGFEVPCFIQDRTPIEDTESSIDLVARGWTLHNHPERLAYSATPPDFGALLIQRRRWAHGGLLILPKLLHTVLRGPWRLRTLAEGWMRCHYLVSIACVNVSLLALLLFPFEHVMRHGWLPVASLPYFTLYGRDLVRCGYRPMDVVRVYALNLLLLPVNLAGVLKSLKQAATGRRSPFGRTPKVRSRTAVAPVYLLAEGALLVLLASELGVDVAHARWLHALLVLVNGGLLAYAFVRFIGIRESAEDLRMQLLGSAPRDARPQSA